MGAVLKFNQVTSLCTQSILILKLPAVTAFQVAITLVALVHPVRYAGFCHWLCLTTILSLAGTSLR